jgi:hypothetical protein
MGSVQDCVTCPRCKNKEAFMDLYYKTGEVFVLCDRCGYNYSKTAVIDKARGERIKARVEKLIKAGKIDRAIDVTGISGIIMHREVDGEWKDIPIKQWSDEEKIKELRSINYDLYFKLDKKRRVVYEIKEGGGLGAFSYKLKGSLKGSIVTVLGHFESKKDKEDFLKWVEENRENLEETTITEKIGLVWKKIRNLNQSS